MKFTPTIVSPVKASESDAASLTNYNNYVSLGAGNFGRIFGNIHLNSSQTKKMIYGVHLNHNSTKEVRWITKILQRPIQMQNYTGSI